MGAAGSASHRHSCRFMGPMLKRGRPARTPPHLSRKRTCPQAGDRRRTIPPGRCGRPLDLTGVAYEEILERLYRPGQSRLPAELSFADRQVPVLLTEEGPVWDSRPSPSSWPSASPRAHLWPRGQYARALARSVCAEMHNGFVALRSRLSMDLARDQALAEAARRAQADIDRVCRLWADCRQRFGQDGAFLFGHASIADALLRTGGGAPAQLSRGALPAEAPRPTSRPSISGRPSSLVPGCSAGGTG